MAVYSFENVQATIAGPGGSFGIGAGSANADEGIGYDYTEDKDKMVTGADGTPMHSLIASKAGKVTVKLLKTSPVNAQLEQLYNFQTNSSLTHGQNVVVISDVVRGDQITCSQVAFAKQPKNDFGKEAGMLEWNFNAGIIDVVLGAGIEAQL